MFVIRFEVKDSKKGRGMIRCRYSFRNDSLISLINSLCYEHDGPETDWYPPLREFCEATEKREKRCKFAFTPQAFKYRTIARLLVQIAEHKDEVKMRVIVDPDIIWVGHSGLQCVFVEKENTNEQKRIKQEYIGEDIPL
jgi:hypothetical protein